MRCGACTRSRRSKTTHEEESGAICLGRTKHTRRARSIGLVHDPRPQQFGRKSVPHDSFAAIGGRSAIGFPFDLLEFSLPVRFSRRADRCASGEFMGVVLGPESGWLSLGICAACIKFKSSVQTHQARIVGCPTTECQSTPALLSFKSFDKNRAFFFISCLSQRKQQMIMG